MKQVQIDESLFRDLCLYFLDDTGGFRTLEREDDIKQGLKEKLAKIERRTLYQQKNMINSSRSG